jgi:hypothetical protein
MLSLKMDGKVTAIFSAVAVSAAISEAAINPQQAAANNRVVIFLVMLVFE